jgi:thioredoxin reductase (NADPH)
MHKSWDCIVVGGGPAGLTAAVYLARFRRRVLVVDAFRSRARYIPRSHNCPGFTQGISGPDLLKALRAQARKYGATIVRGTVDGIARKGAGFTVSSGKQHRGAASVLIATGIVDIVPAIPGLRDGIHRGIVRLCPICDGYEASGKRIAVYGPPAAAISHALFLRTYSSHVTAVFSQSGAVPAALGTQARRQRLALITAPQAIALDESGCRIVTERREHRFDCFYPTMGFEPKCRLAVSLGARADDTGEIIVSPHMQTSVRRLYAAGDAVSGLHQIAVAMGHAAIAATAIHNQLDGRRT